jgi:glycosyltransferase
MKVSLIRGSFNSGTTMTGTIESIQPQDYGDIEYIIVDGASKDNTVEITYEVSYTSKV